MEIFFFPSFANATGGDGKENGIKLQILCLYAQQQCFLVVVQVKHVVLPEKRR